MICTLSFLSLAGLACDPSATLLSKRRHFRTSGFGRSSCRRQTVKIIRRALGKCQGTVRARGCRLRALPSCPVQRSGWRLTARLHAASVALWHSALHGRPVLFARHGTSNRYSGFQTSARKDDNSTRGRPWALQDRFRFDRKKSEKDRRRTRITAIAFAVTITAGIILLAADSYDTSACKMITHYGNNRSWSCFQTWSPRPYANMKRTRVENVVC